MKPYPSHKLTSVIWMPSIPDHWGLKRFRFLSRVSKKKNDDDVERQMLSVSQYHGIIPKAYEFDVQKRSKEDSLNYLVVKESQLVLNTMWLSYGGIGVSKNNGIVSPAYRVYDLEKELNPSFAHYLFRSAIYIDEYTRLSYGIRPNSLQVSTEDFGNLLIPLPAFNEQQAIAGFLDCKTTQIDVLIEKKKQQIELLQEQRSTLIDNIVTSGLNPNVPLKDSGLEWLGKIPSHWGVKQLRHIIREGTSITYGIVQAGPDYEDGVPYIRTQDMAGSVLPRDGYLKTSPEIDKSYERSKVNAGDIVVAIRATVGKALIVPEYLEGANLTQGTAKVSLSELANNRYVYWAINSHSCQNQISSISKGATFREITLYMLRRVAIPFPPLDEQVQISSYLDNQTYEIDLAIDRFRNQITLLHEYRTALISEAVTGKIDVREWKTVHE
jgi:type I restriction enzyme S subunit